MTPYSFTWKQWLVILPLCVVFSLLMGHLSGADMLPLWVRGVALGGVMIAAWVVYFLQRERRAALAETVSMLGLIAGLVCCLMLHSEQQLGSMSPDYAPIALLLIAPLSFLTRQRLIIVASLGVLFICALRCLESINVLHLFVCGMVLWLLGERWQTNRGSKYRCYSWVGVPGFLLMWTSFAAVAAMSWFGLIPTLVTMAVAALLFLVLRPRGGWELPKPLCVFTCLLPLLGLWDVPRSVLILVMEAYAVLLFIAAVHTGRRDWLVLGSVLVMMMPFVISFYCSSSRIFLGIALVAVAVSAGACRWAVRRMPAGKEEEPVDFPAARWQLWLVGALLCGQLGCLLYLYLEPQAELRAAPRALMPAQWERPGKILNSRAQLRIREEHPLQDSAFVGKSLWWGKEWADKQNTAPRPLAEGVQGAQELRSYMSVAAFLRQEGAGLWHIARIEAPGSSEDAPRAGELRVTAHIMVDIKNDIVCTLNFDTYPQSPVWKELALRAWLRDNHEKLSFTAEVAIRRKRGSVITQFYVNGIPLPEVTRLVREGKFGIDD